MLTPRPPVLACRRLPPGRVLGIDSSSNLIIRQRIIVGELLNSATGGRISLLVARPHAISTALRCLAVVAEVLQRKRPRYSLVFQPVAIDSVESLPAEARQEAKVMQLSWPDRTGDAPAMDGADAEGAQTGIGPMLLYVRLLQPDSVEQLMGSGKVPDASAALAALRDGRPLRAAAHTPPVVLTRLMLNLLNVTRWAQLQFCGPAAAEVAAVATLLARNTLLAGAPQRDVAVHVFNVATLTAERRRLMLVQLTLMECELGQPTRVLGALTPPPSTERLAFGSGEYWAGPAARRPPGRGTPVVVPREFGSSERSVGPAAQQPPGQGVASTKPRKPGSSGQWAGPAARRPPEAGRP